MTWKNSIILFIFNTVFIIPLYKTTTNMNKLITSSTKTIEDTRI